MTKDPRFDRLRPLNSDEIEAKLQASFENGRVRFVLKHLKEDANWTELRERCGDALFGFSDFNAVQSGFPVVLGARAALRRGRQISVHSLFHDFEKLAVFEAYLDFRSGLTKAERRSCGLVFPVNGFMQGMIIHNVELPDRSDGSTVRLSYRRETPRKLHFYLQPFNQFLATLLANSHGDS